MLTRVVKIGGRVQSDARLPAALAAAWTASAGALVVVHGGGDEISTLQRALGHANQSHIAALRPGAPRAL